VSGSGTRYLSGAIVEQLDRAQAEIDSHVAAGPDGRCLACGAEAPCPALQRANVTFARYGRLPVRRPGLARRGIAGVGGSGWFS
jgi:hypothetical protein